MMKLKHNCIGRLIVLTVGVFFLLAASSSGAQESNRSRRSGPFGTQEQHLELLRQKRDLGKPQRPLQPSTPEAAGEATPEEGGSEQFDTGGAQESNLPGPSDSLGSQEQNPELLRQERNLGNSQGPLQPNAPEAAGDAAPDEGGREQFETVEAQKSNQPGPSDASGSQEQRLELRRQIRSLRNSRRPLQPSAPEAARDAASGERGRVPLGTGETKHSALTGFTLQAIAWSNKPEERIVVINNRVVREGEFIEGLRVVRIGMDEVLLQKDDKTLRVSYGR